MLYLYELVEHHKGTTAISTKQKKKENEVGLVNQRLVAPLGREPDFLGDGGGGLGCGGEVVVGLAVWIMMDGGSTGGVILVDPLLQLLLLLLLRLYRAVSCPDNLAVEDEPGAVGDGQRSNLVEVEVQGLDHSRRQQNRGAT